MPLDCPTLKSTLDTLAEKREALRLAITEAAETGDFDTARTLEAEVGTLLASLRETMAPAILDASCELFKQDFLGPEAIGETFGFAIDRNDIPLIPFSKQELEEAAKKGFQLILDWDTFPDGTPMTGKAMTERLGGTTSDGGKILFDTDWYENEDFFTKETPKKGWRLVKIEATHTSENYLTQTDSLRKEIEAEYAGKQIPKIYEDAFTEYEAKKPEIERLWKDYNTNWKQIVEILANLKLTALTRESFSELLQRMVVTEKKTKKKLLPNTHAWTRSRSSGGDLVSVGCFGAGGAGVNGYGPRNADGVLGVCSSRRV